MSASSLLVPIHLDALVVGRTQNSSASFAWSQLDYSRLGQMLSPTDTTNDLRDVPGSDQTRVVLHWALPDALTHGDLRGGTASFPSAPNRWLVVRVDAGTFGQNAKLWVIQSDFVDPHTGTTNFLDPTKASTPTSVATTRIGASYTIDAWEAAAPSLRETSARFLSAVGPGNVAFAAFAPHCQNVFSFIDDTVVDGSVYTYALIGWHDRAADDPLTLHAGETPGTATVFRAAMDALGWTLTAPVEGAAADATLYHALVCSVDTRDKATARTRAPDLKIVVGNTAIDALARLIELEADDRAILDLPDAQAWRDLGRSLQQVIQAVGYDRVDALGKPDAQARLAMEIRDHWFGSAPGGLRWAVIPDVINSDATSTPALHADQQAALDAWVAALNTRQRARDGDARTLARKQTELYCLWWKRLFCLQNPDSGGGNGDGGGGGGVVSGGGGDDGGGDDGGGGNNGGGGVVGNVVAPMSASDLAQNLAHELDPSASGSLAAEVWQLAWSLGQPAPDLPPTDFLDRSSQVSDAEREASLRTWADAHCTLPGGQALSSFGLKLTVTSEARFFHPTDPVVLIKGLGRSRRHGEDGRLRADRKLGCRLDDQVVTGLQGGTPSHAPPDLVGTRTAIPALSKALLVEALWLEAGRAKPNDGEAPPPAQYVGVPPADFACARWTQAWSPLFLEWELRYLPTAGLSDWAFDGDALRWQGTGLSSNNAHVYAGRTVLTPHAGAVFRQRLGAFLADHPAIDSANLDALLRTIEGWDMLSQTLEGFGDALLTRTAQATFPPDGVGSALTAGPGAATPVIGALIGEEYHQVPRLERGAPFSPLRAGIAELSQLRVLDAFGQRLDLAGAVHRADGLVPDHPEVLAKVLTSKSPLPGYFALPPRVQQPSRLGVHFLSRDASADLDVVVAPDPDPICGWLLPNHLDRGIGVYDSLGAYLGEIEPPGLAGRSDLSSVQDVTLAQVVSAFERHRSSLADVLQTIDETVWFIDPLGSRKDAMMSVLVGRPLVVVRARIDLTLDAAPAVDESLDRMVFSGSDFLASQPDGGVTKLSFEVRLGSDVLRDDGLLGYFVGGDYDTFHAVHVPAEVTAADAFIKPIGPGNYLSIPLGGPGVVVTMVLDPRGGVHAASGALPVVRAALSEHTVVARSRTLRVRFWVGPILSEPTRLAIPAPGETRGRWTFSAEGLPAEGVPIVDASKLLLFPETARVLRDGWLELDT